MSDDNLFLLGQRGGQDGGSEIFRSYSGFFDEGLGRGWFVQISVYVCDEVSHALLMHDRDELYSELSLDVMGNVLDGWGNRVLGGEWRVYNDSESLNLKVGLIQGFKGASIIKVMVEGYSKVGVCDSGD